MPRVYLHYWLRTLLGLLLVGTGFTKLLDTSEFADHLGDFGIVYDVMVPTAAWLVTVAELFTGLGLMANIRGSLTAVLILLILFVSVLTYGIALGLDIDCGCLVPSFSVGLKWQMVIDVGLIAWCGLVYSTGTSRIRNSETSPSVVADASTKGETSS